MAAKGILFDLDKCIGCRACQVACKAWNQLPGEETRFFAAAGGYQNPLSLSPKTYTLVKFYETMAGDKFRWMFRKHQCMHCVDPACASACPVHALEKTAEGPVTYDPKRCIGCRYCMVACPFSVPRFEWDETIPQVAKCTFCTDRLAVGDGVTLEISQIGKKCHGGCSIMEQTGACVMPREGVFAAVVKGGGARPGDPVRMVPQTGPQSS